MRIIYSHTARNAFKLAINLPINPSNSQCFRPSALKADKAAIVLLSSALRVPRANLGQIQTHVLITLTPFRVSRYSVLLTAGPFYDGVESRFIAEDGWVGKSRLLSFAPARIIGVLPDLCGSQIRPRLEVAGHLKIATTSSRDHSGEKRRA